MESPSIMDDSHLGSLGSDQDEKKQCKDDLLVDLVEEESILWKRNHPSFKNQLLKEQAWLRIATQLGISTTEAERRFKSIREKYRRRKILLERDSTNNVESSKLKRWDLFNKLGFLDDYMIPRNGTESLGMISNKSESPSQSSENISSTNEVSIHPMFMISTAVTKAMEMAKRNKGNISVRPINQICSRSSLSTPSPSTTTAHVINERRNTSDISLTPIVKMETQDDDEMACGGAGETRESYDAGNFNYVGDFIAAELNKLPLRHSFILKNILIREVLSYSEKLMIEAHANSSNNQ